jgi:ATP-dependent helicase HrpA
MPVDVGELDENTIDPHFRFLVRVVDEQGELIDSGRDLSAIQARLGQKAQRSFMDQQGSDVNRDGETDWVFGQLEISVNTTAGAIAWPALVDQGSAVGLRLFDTRDEAAVSHIDGVLRLLGLALGEKLDYLRKHHGLSRNALLAWSPLGGKEILVENLLQRSLVDCAGDVYVVRDSNSFTALCQQTRNEIGSACLVRAGLLSEILPLFGNLSLWLNGNMESRHPDVFDDLTSQMDDLVYEGFLIDLEPGRLEHYPRYLKAMQERLRQFDQDPIRDAKRFALVKPWWDRYRAALEAGCAYDEPMDTFRWMLEEFRVSLFAQKLGTAEKVSEKRLALAWKLTGCNS